MAYLRKRYGGIWYLVDKAGGRYKSVKLGKISAAEAKTVLARYHVDETYLKLDLQADCELTFQEMADEYLTWAATIKAANTVQSERYRLEAMTAVLGQRKFKTLQLQDFDQFLTGKPHYKRLKGNTIKALYKYAVSRRYIRQDLSKNIKAPRIPSPLPKHISQEDVEKIFVHMTPETLRKYKILYYTGMRPGEMLRLKVEDIDCIKRTILIRQSKTGRSRILPMHTELVPIFQELRFGKTKEAYLFPSPTDPRRHQVQIKTGLVKACDRAGVQRVKPYAFRHTFATRILDVSGNLRAAQQLLGHTSIQTTTVYATALDPRLKEDVEKL